MKPSWETYFLNIASVVATRASCPKKQCGCILVKENRILSMGYNGAESGQPDCFEIGCNEEYNHCQTAIHDSENALLAAARFGISVAGAVQYSNYKPCERCQMRLRQAGVAQFIWAYE